MSTQPLEREAPILVKVKIIPTTIVTNDVEVLNLLSFLAFHIWWIFWIRVAIVVT